MDSADRNKRVVRQYLDALNERDLTAAAGLFAGGSRDHFTGSLTTYLALAAFPDFQLNTEHVVAEDDIVTVLATFTGTHQGELMGLEPTHKGVTGRAAFSFRLVDGKIDETWAEIEPWTLLQQLGAPAVA
jgi:predicted ester cyclase